MKPINTFAPAVLADVVRRQPSSPARTSFAWTLAVGPALARVTAVELTDGVLTVRPRDPRWAGEISRARDTILQRLQGLLGPDEIRRIHVARTSV